ncbi:hypothetical protein ACOJTA_11475 [Malaciobacter sp. WC5094]
MTCMIRVKRSRYSNETTMEIDKSIFVNSYNINVIEDSKLAIREKARIIFNKANEICMIETKEKIERIVNLK